MRVEITKFHTWEHPVGTLTDVTAWEHTACCDYMALAMEHQSFSLATDGSFLGIVIMEGCDILPMACCPFCQSGITITWRK